MPYVLYSVKQHAYLWHYINHYVSIAGLPQNVHDGTMHQHNLGCWYMKILSQFAVRFPLRNSDINYNKSLHWNVCDYCKGILWFLSDNACICLQSN